MSDPILDLMAAEVRRLLHERVEDPDAELEEDKEPPTIRCGLLVVRNLVEVASSVNPKDALSAMPILLAILKEAE